jgi:hypothetical protein
MIEKYKSYLPILEKIALAKKIAEHPNVIDENGIINNSNLRIASTTFFVGAYCEDKQFTTKDYDEIIQNRVEDELKEKIDFEEYQEWREILQNEIDLVVEQRKVETSNMQMAITRLINSLNKKVEKLDIDKMFKEIMKIVKDPSKVKNIETLIDIAKNVN